MMREWNKLTPEERHIIEPFLQEVPVRIASIARALGVEVKSATLKPRISGQIQKSETSASGFRIRVNRHESPTRQRFTIAHEIGHYLLHRDEIGDGIEDTILYRSTLSDYREAEANRMAAELLMPRKKILEFLKLFGGSATRTVAQAMAEKFDVSEAAMCVRLGIPWQ